MFLESFTAALCTDYEANTITPTEFTILQDSPYSNHGSLAILKHFLTNLFLTFQKNINNNQKNHHYFICISFNYSNLQFEQFIPCIKTNKIKSYSNAILLDGVKDRLKWEKNTNNNNNSSVFSEIIPATNALNDLQDLIQLLRNKISSITSSSTAIQPHFSIFFTGISHLFLAHSPHNVIRALQFILSNISNSSLVLHLDSGCLGLLNELELNALKSMANTHIQIQSSTMQKIPITITTNNTASNNANNNNSFTGMSVNVRISHVRSSGKRAMKTEQWQIFNDHTMKAKKIDNTTQADIEDQDSNEAKIRNLMASSKKNKSTIETSETNAAGAPLPEAATVATFTLGLTEKQRAQRAKVHFPYAPNLTAGTNNNVQLSMAGLQISSNDNDSSLLDDDEFHSGDSEGELDDDLDI